MRRRSLNSQVADAGRYSFGIRRLAAIRSAAVVFLLGALLSLAFGSSARAQYVSGSSANPATFSAAGQTVVFSVQFTSIALLQSLTMTANAGDVGGGYADDTITCPSVSGYSNVPFTVTCTDSHVTNSFDTAVGTRLHQPRVHRYHQEQSNRYGKRQSGFRNLCGSGGADGRSCEPE